MLTGLPGSGSAASRSIEFRFVVGGWEVSEGSCRSPTDRVGAAALSGSSDSHRLVENFLTLSYKGGQMMKMRWNGENRGIGCTDADLRPAAGERGRYQS